MLNSCFQGRHANLLHAKVTIHGKKSDETYQRPLPARNTLSEINMALYGSAVIGSRTKQSLLFQICTLGLDNFTSRRHIHGDLNISNPIKLFNECCWWLHSGSGDWKWLSTWTIRSQGFPNNIANQSAVLFLLLGTAAASWASHWMNFAFVFQ